MTSEEMKLELLKMFDASVNNLKNILIDDRFCNVLNNDYCKAVNAITESAKKIMEYKCMINHISDIPIIIKNKIF